MSENRDENVPSEDLEKVLAERDNAKKEYLYLLAEFDNYRKNAIKDRSELMKYGSEKAVKEAGRLREEGKEYVVQDGDIMEFRFNV
jgi:ribosome-binding ATPase YchF (GTP1/OBG family)